LHEWRGASRRTKGWLALSLAVLVASTMIVGYGNYLGTRPPAGAASASR
jgi:L-rhamnose-H+ transport protein